MRPLVYRVSSPGISIASQVEQLVGTLGDRPVLDDQMIVEHLLWRHKSVDGTFFRDIRRVPGGHVLSVTPSGVHVQRYWVPPTQSEGESSLRREDYLEEFRRLFVRSVERRLRSVAPVMIHVSGGLDSSSVAVVADGIARSGKLPAPAVRGISGAYPGLACDEQSFVDSVARQVGFPIYRWDATQSDPIDLVSPTVECPGGRLANVDGTKGDVTIALQHSAEVILSGTAGDQLTTPGGIVQESLGQQSLGASHARAPVFPWRDRDLASLSAEVRFHSFDASAYTSTAVDVPHARTRMGRPKPPGACPRDRSS